MYKAFIRFVRQLLFPRQRRAKRSAHLTFGGYGSITIILKHSKKKKKLPKVLKGLNFGDSPSHKSKKSSLSCVQIRRSDRSVEYIRLKRLGPIAAFPLITLISWSGTLRVTSLEGNMTNSHMYLFGCVRRTH